MRTTLSGCTRELSREIAGLRRLDKLNQSQHAMGHGKAPTRPQLHVLTEGVFLSAFRAYEQFVRNAFLLLCRGAQLKGRKRVHSCVLPKSTAHAEEILRSSMHFLDWSSPDELVSRAEIYLRDGYPIKDFVTANMKPLRDLKKLRNRIAHSSGEAQSAYEKVVLEHYSTRPLRMPMPGEFLLLSRRGAGTYHLVYYLDIIESLALFLLQGR